VPPEEPDPNRVSLDRTRGRQLDIIIQAAIRRSGQSRDTAKALLAGHFAGPAYVWAVRAIEMYVKEVMLLPLYLEASGGDWDQSWKSIRETFSSGKWNRALRAVEETYGPLDAMKTEDNFGAPRMLTLRFYASFVGAAHPPDRQRAARKSTLSSSP
jgi:hypothetical protein